MINEEAIEYAKLSIQSIENDNDENSIAYEFYTCVIKELSEPKIPLSVIEKIITEIEERATYEGIYLDRNDVLGIIDKEIKGYTQQ